MEIKGFNKEHTAKKAEINNKPIHTSEKSNPFVDKLHQVEKKLWRGRLDQLLNKIHTQGSVLAKNRSLKELKKYKTLVKSFMEEAIDSSLQLNKNSSWSQRGRHQLLIIVEKVDQRVEELTELMIAEEKDTLAILDKLDEIKGLLVDLYT